MTKNIVYSCSALYIQLICVGQLYVALSRAMMYNSIYALLDNLEHGLHGLTKNKSIVMILIMSHCRAVMA